MKKIFYLMSVVCLMMAASCEKPENGNNEKPQTEPPVVTVPEGVKTAGAELVLKAEGLVEGAEFYLKSGEEKITLDGAKVSASGATVKLPYCLGEYTLFVKQEGVEVEIGKITIAVTGVVLPENAVSAGDEITIAGNGFASDALIFINGIESVTAVEAAGVKVTVPEGVVEGGNSVSVKQAGTEQEFDGKLKVASEVTAEKKNRTSINITYGGDPFFSISAEYRDGEPVEMTSDFLGTSSTTQITKSGNTYEFSGDVNWSFTVENGRVEKFIYEGSELPWTYNSDGQLTEFYTDNEYLYKLDYEDGNCVSFGSLYENPDMLVTNPYEIDFGTVWGALMYVDGNCDILYSAILFGWVGNPSKRYPSVNVDEGDRLPYVYKFDNDGYATSMAVEGFMEVVCEYEK